MGSDMTEVSIIIPTFNGAAYLRQVLEMIGRQKMKSVEIIAIDSGSTDDTLKILREFPVRLMQIPQAEFSHPGTRNLGARAASGKYVVFLTQDATPADSCWLESLLRPFDEARKIVATFSRQIPRPGADPLEASDLHHYFPSQRRVNTMPDDPAEYRKRIWSLIELSNASAAYNRELLLQNPFDERLKMGEDQEWAKRMLEQGFSIAYEPESMVLHSHQHTLAQKRERNIDMGVSFSQFLYPELGYRSFPLLPFAGHLLMSAQYIFRNRFTPTQKLLWLLRSPAHRAVYHYYYWRGWNLSHSKTTSRTKGALLNPSRDKL